MKSTIQRAVLAFAVASLGAVGAASAQTTSSAPAATPPQGQHHGHFHHHGGFVGTLLRATKQLSGTNALTAAQQAQIKTFFQNERAAHQAGTQSPHFGPTVTGNPTSSQYGSAVSAAVTGAQERITNDSNMAKQLYTALQLTPQQQTQLQTILSSMEAKEQARRAQWAAKHAGNG
jgi:Spy/CpxP family protein refolding chaperone